MIRECALSDISDGKIYDLNDMVKADTAGCQGCFKCCTGMGTSIILDPYDIHILKRKLNCSFQDLISKCYIELNVFEGVILPNLPMGENDCCVFLIDGRCSIHDSRPGLCRIFPLGRVYTSEDESFNYFLQANECVKSSRAKIKVKKWIATQDTENNQSFIGKWHFFVRGVTEKIYNLHSSGRGEMVNDIAMYILNEFYVADFASDDIYNNIINKIENAKKQLC